MNATELERMRLNLIVHIKSEMAGLDNRRDELQEMLNVLVQAGVETEARTFASALSVEVIQEIVGLAKIPGIKCLRELTSCSLQTAVHVYDVLRNDYS